MFENLFEKLASLSYVRKFGIKEKIFLFREMSYLLHWWVSIIESINIIKNNTENQTIKEICNELYTSLKKWEPLFRSMTRIPSYFNEWDINIVRSWENSGELVKVLKYLADEYEFLYNVRNKYVWAMIYPCIIFIICIIAIFVIFKFILPWILSILDQFEWMVLPFSTRVLVAITEFVINYSNHIFIILWFAIFAFSIVLSIEEGKRWFDKKIFKLPIFGKITKYYFLIKFLRYMKLLIYSGMSYSDIFKLLRRIMTNSVYKDMIDEILEWVRKWEMISWIIWNYKVIIPVEVVALIKVWEETAEIANAVENAIWLYEEEFNNILNNLSKIIEPILIVVVGWIVGFVSISVFGIIWNILDSLQV